MNRRVLLVTYPFPPSRSVGAVRWGAMSKYLQRRGFEITVLTSRLWGETPGLEVSSVIRPRDLESSEFLRRLLRRPKAQISGGGAGGTSRLTKVVVPDGWLLTWVPFALQAARRELRDRGFDCIVTTSPGESTHLVGLNVRRLGPAWVADFRDGWIFEPGRPAFTARPLDVLDRRLESTVVSRADRVVAVTDELAEDFRRRLAVDVRCIPNGWDPDELAKRRPGPASKVDGRFRIVYTGRLGAGTERRRPEPLFAALERLHKREPGLATKLEIVVAGRQTARDVALLASLPRAYVVTDAGELPRLDALGLQVSADALVLWSNGSVATLKLFEYLAAGRPILHVGGPGATARILRETGSGVTVSAEDVDGIVNRLREIARGEFGRRLEPHGIDRYSYAWLADEMAEVLEEAIARRARSG